MLFTIKEMEVLCVFHAGTISKTLEAIRQSAAENTRRERLEDIKSVAEKLSAMKTGDVAFINFEPE